MTFARKLTHLLAGLMLLGSGFVHAVDFARSLDVYQGFNFKKDKQVNYGYLSSLAIGGQPLVADISVPLPNGTSMKVVGVLTSVQWHTGVTDPIYLGAQISTSNKQVIARMMVSPLRDTSVNFQFQTFEYDPKAKKYYQSFGTIGTALTGLIQKQGQDLRLVVASQPSTEVQSPLNWSFMLGVVPAPRVQALPIATSAAASVVKQWGVTMAGSK